MLAKFITLDGIDGAGKTTQLDVIRDWFAAHRLPVLFTREPGGTPLGEALRDLLLNPETQVSLHTETLLMFCGAAAAFGGCDFACAGTGRERGVRPLYRCHVCLPRRRARFA